MSEGVRGSDPRIRFLPGRQRAPPSGRVALVVRRELGGAVRVGSARDRTKRSRPDASIRLAPWPERLAPFFLASSTRLVRLASLMSTARRRPGAQRRTARALLGWVRPERESEREPRSHSRAAVDGHRELLATVRAGDAAATRRAMQQHLDRVGDRQESLDPAEREA